MRLILHAVTSAIMFVLWFLFLGWAGLIDELSWQTSLIIVAVMIPGYMIAIPLDKRWKEQRERKKRLASRGFR